MDTSTYGGFGPSVSLSQGIALFQQGRFREAAEYFKVTCKILMSQRKSLCLKMQDYLSI